MTTPLRHGRRWDEAEDRLVLGLPAPAPRRALRSLAIAMGRTYAALTNRRAVLRQAAKRRTDGS